VWSIALSRSDRSRCAHDDRNWRGYGSIRSDGVIRPESHIRCERSSIFQANDEKFILAMSIHPDEQKDLTPATANGWQLKIPRASQARRRIRAFIRDQR